MNDVKKILVIDDSEGIRELVTAIVDDYCEANDISVKVVTAVDGMDGIKKYDKANPVAIITDLDMPKADGEFFTKLIRCTDKKTPILLHTAAINIKRKELYSTIASKGDALAINQFLKVALA